MAPSLKDKSYMLLKTLEEFKATLPAQGRLLGLDVGDTTIGLALTDALRSIASPLHTIERKKLTSDIESLKQTIIKHHIKGFIIGNPINMDGSPGRRTQSTRTFVSNIAKQIELPMLLWDERLSTMAVERMMIEADMTRQRRAELVDKLAASYMLQGAIDRMNAL